MTKLTIRSAILLGFFTLTGLLQQSAIAQQNSLTKRKTPAPEPPQGEHVFYASHSLMWYVPKHLGELAEAAKIKDHKLVGEQSLGASRTLQHWQVPDFNNKAKQALTKGEASVLVMSPIQFPDEGIENFVKLGLEHNPKMHFVVQLSWGGGDTDNQDFPKGGVGQRRSQ